MTSPLKMVTPRSLGNCVWNASSPLCKPCVAFVLADYLLVNQRWHSARSEAKNTGGFLVQSSFQASSQTLGTCDVSKLAIPSSICADVCVCVKAKRKGASDMQQPQIQSTGASLVGGRPNLPKSLGGSDQRPPIWHEFRTKVMQPFFCEVCSCFMLFHVVPFYVCYFNGWMTRYPLLGTHATHRRRPATLPPCGSMALHRTSWRSGGFQKPGPHVGRAFEPDPCSSFETAPGSEERHMEIASGCFQMIEMLLQLSRREIYHDCYLMWKEHVSLLATVATYSAWCSSFKPEWLLSLGYSFW